MATQAEMKAMSELHDQMLDLPDDNECDNKITLLVNILIHKM